MREHEIKLKQQRDSLQQKLNTLRQLDAEILDLVAEEEIEGEIEGADLLEENVQLAIANIENALSPKVVCSNVNTEANVSESTSANEVQIGSNSSPPSASTSNSSSSVRRNTQVKLPKLELKKFWDLESLGVRPPSVYEEFVEKLLYKGGGGETTMRSVSRGRLHIHHSLKIMS